MSKQVLVWFGVLAIIAIVLGCVMMYPASKPANLRLLRSGMSKHEVINLIGRPSEEHNYSDGIYWIYPDGFHDPFVVEFDQEGRFRGFR